MSALTFARDVVRNVAGRPRLSAQIRRAWAERLSAVLRRRADVDERTAIRFEARLRQANAGWLLRVWVGDCAARRTVWLRWSPEADPAAMTQTLVNMRWWRAEHPELARPVADVLDYWADEAVLVMEGRAGQPLGRAIRRLERGAVDADVLAAVARLGGWLRAYAWGRDAYGADIEPLLGSQVRRDAGGGLTVQVQPLIEQRIGQARRSAEELARRGYAAALDWVNAFELEDMIADWCQPVRAGFIHGDFKPDNVLFDGTDIAVIDWWTAPRVSWSLADVAGFAGNVWLERGVDASEIWQRFAAAYFADGMDACTARTIDLLATMLCLGVLARMARGPRGAIARRWIGATVERLVDSRTLIGGPASMAVQAG